MMGGWGGCPEIYLHLSFGSRFLFALKAYDCGVPLLVGSNSLHSLTRTLQTIVRGDLNNEAIVFEGAMGG